MMDGSRQVCFEVMGDGAGTKFRVMAPWSSEVGCQGHDCPGIQQLCQSRHDRFKAIGVSDLAIANWHIQVSTQENTVTPLNLGKQVTQILQHGFPFCEKDTLTGQLGNRNTKAFRTPC